MAKPGRTIDRTAFDRLPRRPGRTSRWRDLLENLEVGKPRIIELEEGEKPQSVRVALQNAARAEGYTVAFRWMAGKLVALKEKGAE